MFAIVYFVVGCAGVAILLASLWSKNRKPYFLAYAGAVFLMGGLQLMEMREQLVQRQESVSISNEIEAIKKELDSGRTFTADELAGFKGRLKALRERLSAVR